MTTSFESESAAIDTAHYRRILGHFPTGVTIVTATTNGQPTGFTIGSFTSVSLVPPLVGFLPQRDSETWAEMADAGSFCVNVLGEHQSALCWTFSKRATERTRFDDVEWHSAASGAPIIDGAVAWIDCAIERVEEMGDHYFVLGRVIALDADAQHDGQQPRPMVFYRGAIGGFLGA